MLIGLTGAGKSTIVKTLTGKDAYVGHSTKAGTQSFQMFYGTIDGQSYIFIDTPGFDDPDREDVEVFKEIMGWFESVSSYCDLSGILYVHAMGGSPRFTGSRQLNLDMLQELCGEEYYQKVSIITTMWGTLSKAAAMKAEKQQRDTEAEHWKELIDGGARIFQHRTAVVEFEDPPETAEEIAELAQQLEASKAELSSIIRYYGDSSSSMTLIPEIQREVRNKVPILETKAAKVLRRYDIPAVSELHVGSDKTEDWFESLTRELSTAFKAVIDIGTDLIKAPFIMVGYLGAMAVASFFSPLGILVDVEGANDVLVAELLPFLLRALGILPTECNVRGSQ